MKLPWEIVARGIVSPEGPAADREGNVFLVSRWSGTVLRVDFSGHVRQLCQTGGKPQSVALLETGDLLLADAKNRALQLIARDGRLSTLIDSIGGKPLLGPNDLVVGNGEVVYMSDPGLDLNASGRVLRIDLKAGECFVLDDDLKFPNGITISDDGAFLYLTESSRHRVLRYPLCDDGRSLGRRELFHQFEDYLPDGIVLDATGRLLVALHGSGTLAVLSPAGRLLELIPTGGAKCTNCVFGGDDFQTLYITEDEQEALLRTRWPVSGQRRFSRSLA